MIRIENNARTDSMFGKGSQRKHIAGQVPSQCARDKVHKFMNLPKIGLDWTGSYNLRREYNRAARASRCSPQL